MSRAIGIILEDPDGVEAFCLVFCKGVDVFVVEDCLLLTDDFFSGVNLSGDDSCSALLMMKGENLRDIV